MHGSRRCRDAAHVDRAVRRGPARRARTPRGAGLRSARIPAASVRGSTQVALRRSSTTTRTTASGRPSAAVGEPGRLHVDGEHAVVLRARAARPRLMMRSTREDRSGVRAQSRAGAALPRASALSGHGDGRRAVAPQLRRADDVAGAKLGRRPPRTDAGDRDGGRLDGESSRCRDPRARRAPCPSAAPSSRARPAAPPPRPAAARRRAARSRMPRARARAPSRGRPAGRGGS